jgi:hypothetical protein
VLRFARDLAAPFTNNQAERDLRRAKTQIKISGCHRSSSAASAWLRVRGYISTLREHGTNVLTALGDAITGNPWKPRRDLNGYPQAAVGMAGADLRAEVEPDRHRFLGSPFGGRHVVAAAGGVRSVGSEMITHSYFASRSSCSDHSTSSFQGIRTSLTLTSALQRQRGA